MIKIQLFVLSSTINRLCSTLKDLKEIDMICFLLKSNCTRGFQSRIFFTIISTPKNRRTVFTSKMELWSAAHSSLTSSYVVGKILNYTSKFAELLNGNSISPLSSDYKKKFIHSVKYKFVIIVQNILTKVNERFLKTSVGKCKR